MSKENNEKEVSRKNFALGLAAVAWVVTFCCINKGLYELMENTEGINPSFSPSQTVYAFFSLWASYKGANYVGGKVGNGILRSIS